MTEIKTIQNQANQGDLFFMRIASLPEDAREVKAGPEGYIVAHSETGHHHVIADVAGIQFYESEDPLIAYLRVSEGAFEGGSAVLRHLRGWHTHESVQFTPGTFKVTRQEERAGASWVRVQD